jgi:hypothetical protein
MVFIEIVSVFFIVLVRWRGARPHNALRLFCKVRHQAAIAKFTNAANDYQQA